MTKKWVVGFLLLVSPLVAAEFPLTTQKHYLPKEQVDVHNDMIVVHVEEGDFIVDAICADQGGVFFFEEMMRCPKCYRPINPKNTCQNPICR